MFWNFRHVWLERPLAVFDLETTGRDPARDRVVALAVVKYAPRGDASRWRHFRPDGAPVAFTHRVNPGCPIPPEATAVHGITDADVAGMPTFRAVAHQTARFLEGCDLAGFGVRRFDLPLLAAEFDRTGVAFPLEGRRVVDVLSLYHAVEPRDLKAAVRRYCGVEHASAHDAEADVLATAAVLDALVGAHPGVSGNLDDLADGQGFVDAGGRFRRERGRVVLASGKHAGRPLEEVAAADPGYLRWMLRQTLLPDTRERVERALDPDPAPPEGRVEPPA